MTGGIPKKCASVVVEHRLKMSKIVSFTRTPRKVQHSNTAISDLTSGSSRDSPCGRLQLAAHVPWQPPPKRRRRPALS